MPRRRLLLCAWIAALAALVPYHAARAQSASGTARLAKADEAAALAWLKKSARPLSSDPTAAELQPLLARLDGARIIGLGEATHGTHEDFAFKAALIKALAGAGRINAVAFVTSYRSGKRLDAYVAGGPGTAAVALRDSGLSPAWVTEEVAGLLDWLRRWNAVAGNERVHVVGVDVQDALRDTHTALELLAAVEPEAAAPLLHLWKDQLTGERLQRPFDQAVRDWTRAQWEEFFVAAQVLEDLLTRPTTRLRESPGYLDARHSARAARLGLLAYEVGAEATSPLGPSAENELARDLAVGDQLLAIVGPPARAVLWAHDAQVARGVEGSSAVYSTGDLLLDRLGAGYRTVGFAWRRGAYHALSGDAAGNPDRSAGFTPRTATLPADSLGALLAKAGQRRAWFDLRALPAAPWSKRWLAQPYERGWVGIGGEPAPPSALGHAFDVLVFFDTITPSRLLRATP